MKLNADIRKGGGWSNADTCGTGERVVKGVIFLQTTLKFRSEFTRLGGTDAAVLQSNCVRRTCSRSLHGNCFGRRLKPYSPRYRPSVLFYLTDRKPATGSKVLRPEHLLLRFKSLKNI